MSNIERRYAYLDEGVFPEEGEYGVTYLTLYSSNAGNTYDGWVYDPDNKVRESLTARTYGYRNPDYPQYCWDDEVVVDLSNAQSRQESSEFIQGRITSFNTNVSDRPIVLQDIDITGLTEEERENLATTVLFCAIPLVQDAYIQAQVEVQCKCNLSPDNTSGEMRIEAFYILNDESDRTMRPNPVHTFTVSSPNERHTLPWLYWNPALRHDDHNYIGVKLICTGGTAEIGISDNPNYGDAMITLGSAGMTGDKIDSGRPVRIWIEGEQLVPLGYRIDINDYDVFCEYDTGEIYVVTHFCTFNPEIGERVEENFTLQAWYMGLHAALRVQVALVDHIELLGVEDIYGSYTLDINDYTVLGYLENGDVYDVTDQCGFFPEMGTTLTDTTTLTAMFVNPGPLPVTDELTLTKHVQRGTRQPYGGLIYTLYDDNRVVITGSVATNIDPTDPYYDGAWVTFGDREGIIDPYREVRRAQLPEHVLEWRASGKPSSILLGNDTYSSRQTGSFVWFVNFRQMDCSKVMFVDLRNQKLMDYATLESLQLEHNDLHMDPFTPYSNNYIVRPVSYSYSPILLQGMENIIAFDQRKWDLSRIKSTMGLLSGYEREVKLHDLLSVVYTEYMFHSNSRLESVEIDGLIYNEDENLNTSMKQMWYHCENLTRVKITNADYSKVYDITELFDSCYNIDEDATKLVGEICSTPKKSLFRVFRYCTSLRNLEPLRDIDLSEMESIEQFCKGCSSLIDISPLADWNVSNIFDFTEAFHSCDKLRVVSPISGWDVFVTPRWHGPKRAQPNFYDKAYYKTTVYLEGMFAVSALADARNDDYRSTHLLDANALTWSGYKSYAQRLYNAYMEDYDFWHNLRIGFTICRITDGVSGPERNYRQDMPELSWSIQNINSRDGEAPWASDVPYDTKGNPYSIFGGTDWAANGYQAHNERGLNSAQGHIIYGLPEWALYFINYNYYVGELMSDPTFAQYIWNGDRVVAYFGPWPIPS